MPPRARVATSVSGDAILLAASRILRLYALVALLPSAPICLLRILLRAHTAILDDLGTLLLLPSPLLQ
jgi:hypothetical protein